ncbi:MAG: hypothetical protein OHK0053_05540 [Microscillaceae bacterium]
MDYPTLKKLVRQGEGLHLEFKLKANHPEKIVREAVAFANSEGGLLLIGVDDDKTIRGLKYASEDEYSLVEAFAKYCSPPIDYLLEKVPVEANREVLVFTIPKSENVHFVIENFETGWGQAYVRVEDKSLKASREMREILRGRRRNRNVQFQYGTKEEILMKYLETHRQITVDEFSRTAKIPRRVASRTLVLLVLARVLQIQPNPVHADAFTFTEEDT